MGPKTERLIEALGEAVSLLQTQDEKYHASQVSKCKELLEQSDIRGVTHVLSVFNGKNSVYDIDWLAGYDDPNRISIGDRFGVLSSTIYELAEEIRREVEGGER